MNFASGTIPLGAKSPRKCIHTVSEKNVPPLACCNFDTGERILIFFGGNLTDKVSNQKTLYYGASNNLCFCTTWQNRKHENCIFPLSAALVHWLNSTSCLIFSIFWLTTHTHAAVWLSNSCNQCVQHGAFVEHGSRETKSRALQQLDCVARIMHQSAVFSVSYFAR